MYEDRYKNWSAGEKKPIKKKPVGKVPETWQEAVLEYLVRGGKVRDAGEDYVPKNLRELGLSNKNIGPKGTPFDILISELGFGDLIYKTGDSERDLVRDLLAKYPSHKERVSALNELRGKGAAKEPDAEKLKKFERYEAGKPKLDEIILNEYMNSDGELQINDIIKDSDKIGKRANVDDDAILKYLKGKEDELSVLDESVWDDPFGEFETEEITDETKEQIADQEGPEAEELDKLAEARFNEKKSEKSYTKAMALTEVRNENTELSEAAAQTVKN